MVGDIFREVHDGVSSVGLTGLLGIWGAVLSTILGLITISDKLSKNRLRLATTYFFTGQEGVSDKIVIVNLSVIPVQVSHWTLAWRPSFFHRFLSSIDVTPDGREDVLTFTIPAQGTFTLEFDEQDKFDWSYRSARHRQLYLTLHIFGRTPKTLRVGAGQ